MDPYKVLEEARRDIEDYVVDKRSKEEHAEIHTPFELIEDMVDRIPEEEYYDPNTTILDPCCGIANFPTYIAQKLMETLKGEIEDPEERYRHIMEEMIYMIELQVENGIRIEKLLNPTGDFNLNLKCVDALELQVQEMEPSDWDQHRFRTRYTGKSFFQYEPTPEELEKLEKVHEIADEDWIIEQFERGY